MIGIKNIRSRFLIRIDDVHPEMDKKNFDRLITLLDTYNIKAILGVIPNNKDKSICRDKFDLNFWHNIKLLEKKGFLISQHGYNHVYDSNDGGLLKINKKSEFAGHNYEIQKEKLLKGKEELKKKGIISNVFMAPSHSFDINTIRVLKENNFSITDGFGLWPRVKNEILFIPQLFAGPRDFYIGLYTMCFHTNTMSENDFKTLCNHLRLKKDKYINPDQIQHFIIGSNQFHLKTLDILFSILFRCILKLKRNFLKPILNSI